VTPFNKSDANMMRTAWELSAGLLSFIVALGLGYWAGRMLDGWFGTAPWLVRIFVALGFIAGVLNVSRTVSQALRSSSGPGPGGDSGRPPTKAP
jgi:ATP synthase protein I